MMRRAFILALIPFVAFAQTDRVLIGGTFNGSRADNFGTLRTNFFVSGATPSREYMTFDGVNDMMIRHDGGRTFSNTTFTVSFWMRADTNKSCALVYKGAFVEGGWGISLGSSGGSSGCTISVLIRTTGGNIITNTAPISGTFTTGVWTHVSVRLKTGVVGVNTNNIFLGGLLSEVSRAGTFNGNYDNRTNTFISIGARNNGSNEFFKGRISTVEIRNGWPDPRMIYRTSRRPLP